MGCTENQESHIQKESLVVKIIYIKTKVIKTQKKIC